MNAKSTDTNHQSTDSDPFTAPIGGVFANQHWGVLQYKETILGIGRNAVIDGKKQNTPYVNTVSIPCCGLPQTSYIRVLEDIHHPAMICRTR